MALESFLFELLPDGLNYLRMQMPQAKRTIAADAVQELPACRIPYVAALGSVFRYVKTAEIEDSGNPRAHVFAVFLRGLVCQLFDCGFVKRHEVLQ